MKSRRKRRGGAAAPDRITGGSIVVVLVVVVTVIVAVAAGVKVVVAPGVVVEADPDEGWSILMVVKLFLHDATVIIIMIAINPRSNTIFPVIFAFII